MALIPAKDYVQVQDEAGTVLPDLVPKHWLGTDLATGLKAVTRPRVAATKQDGETSTEGDGS